MLTSKLLPVPQTIASLCSHIFSAGRSRFGIAVTGGLQFSAASAPSSANAGVGSMNESFGASVVTNGGGSEAAVPTILEFGDKPPQNPWITSARLALVMPWNRVRKGSFLKLKLEGDIPERMPPRWVPSPKMSMPTLCECIRKAAYDPRVGGLYLEVEPLTIGFSRLQEIIDHVEFFRKSGKPTVAYVERGREMEYLVASACEEVYVPPLGQLLLFGHAIGGVYVRGTLDKLGIEPTVKRLGKYKAGNILSRKDMSEEDRETYTSLLDGIHSHFTSSVAQARGKTEKEVKELIDAGIYDMQHLVEGGLVTAVKYPDEIQHDLDKRFGNQRRKKAKPQPVTQPQTPAGRALEAWQEDTERAPKQLMYVEFKKYRKVSPALLGLTGRKVVAVVRECGSIMGGSKEQDGRVLAAPLAAKLRKLRDDRHVAGVVLRLDSPGGDPLASDLMWRELRKLAKVKPVVASMWDIAASGGYYVSMGAPTVLAAPLTLTGSIGVWMPRFNLAEWYKKIGFSKELLSRGKYAEIYNETRNASADEDKLMDSGIRFIYDGFRDKAALSRGMQAEEMEKHAQGRVWLGRDACSKGLTDHEGGVANAIALVKQAANIPPSQQIKIREVSSMKFNPFMLLNAGSAAGLSLQGLMRLLISNPLFLLAMLQSKSLPALAQGMEAPTKLSSALTDASLQMESHEPIRLEMDPRVQCAVSDTLSRSVHQVLPSASLTPFDVGNTQHGV